MMIDEGTIPPVIIDVSLNRYSRPEIAQDAVKSTEPQHILLYANAQSRSTVDILGSAQ